MQKPTASTLLLALMGLIAAAGCDTTNCDGIDECEVSASGTLSGVVQELGTEASLAAITVVLNGLEQTTAPDGGFVFREVPVGSQTLQVSTTGFDAYTKQVVVEEGENNLDIFLVRTFEIKFDHSNILASDLDRSASFYENILGLNELESPWGPNASVRVFSTGENQQLHIIRSVDNEPIKQHHIAFSVPDFDASLSFLTEQGIEYETFAGASGAFQTRPDGVNQTYFQDPDGNWIEFNDAQAAAQTSAHQYDHQGVFVSSLTASGAFYGNTLRLDEIVSPWDDPTLTRFFTMGNHGELHLVPTDDPGFPKEKGVHMAYNVQFFDAYVGFLAARGVEYGNFAGDIGQLDTRPDGVRQVYFQDPYGNWIEVDDAQY